MCFSSLCREIVIERGNELHEKFELERKKKKRSFTSLFNPCLFHVLDTNCNVDFLFKKSQLNQIKNTNKCLTSVIAYRSVPVSFGLVFIKKKKMS